MIKQLIIFMTNNEYASNMHQILQMQYFETIICNLLMVLFNTKSFNRIDVRICTYTM